MNALRHCLVLFVDISGSSRLYQQLGDDAAHRHVQGCLDRLRTMVAARGGRVVKDIGDGLLCEFPDADAGVLAADAMQRAVENETDEGDLKLGIHAGCHFGPVIDTAGDLHGDTVNIAARVMNVAREGQIIMTQDTAARLSPPWQRNLRLLHGVHVKGRRDALMAMEYVWRESGEFTVPAPSPVAAPSARLKLQFDGRELWIDRQSLSTISLGRGIGCQIIVDDPQASRLHASIEARGDKFVLIDQSSNGTYVAVEGAPELCLKREEMILPAHGRIALGISTTEPHATLVYFSRERGAS